MPRLRDRVREFRRVPASALRPNPENWRLHPQGQVDALREIIESVGFAGAELAFPADGKGPDGDFSDLMLVDGHLRREIVGDELIPVLVTDLTLAEARKLMVVYDPIGAMAEADAAKLDALLREIDVDTPALMELCREVAQDAECEWAKETATKDVVEDEVPEPPADPVTKPGDLWILGRHRLLCGDSTKREDVERLMGGKRADLCFTSPPYAQQRAYTKESTAKVADWDGLMQGVFGNLPMSDAGQVLVNLGMVHRDGEWVPYWDPWIEWMRSQGWRRFGWYVWDKKQPLPMRDGGRLLPQHEWVFHLNRQAVSCNKTINCATAGRTHSFGLRGPDGRRSDLGTAVTADKRVPGSVVAASPREGGSHNHPAVMSVRLPIEFLSIWNGDVYEPFCGSGTTLIAAEQLDRTCYGMEISPAYCDVIVQRWENLTGGTPKRS